MDKLRVSRHAASPDPAARPFQIGLWHIVSNGNGQFLFTPSKPAPDCTVLEAARYLGVSDDTVRALIDLVDDHNHPLFDVSRPSPRKTRISWDSVERHKLNSKDPEYWDRLRRKNRSASLFLRN